MNLIIKKMNREDLPSEGMRKISDVIGVNQAKSLLVKLPGYCFYIPKSFYNEVDEVYMKKHTCKKPTEIAHDLGCSLSTAYRLKKKYS